MTNKRNQIVTMIHQQLNIKQSITRSSDLVPMELPDDKNYKLYKRILQNFVK